MFRLLPRGRPFIFFLGALITLLTVLGYVWQPTFLGFLNQKTYDTLLQVSRPQAASHAPLIVEVDDRALAAYGQWPWPRHRLALLLDKLRTMEPSVVALDLVLPEPDRSSVTVLRRELNRDLGRRVVIHGLTPEQEDNDAILARTLAQGPFILGHKLAFSPQEASLDQSCHLHPVSAVFANLPPGTKGTDYFFTAKGAICNLDLFNAAVKRSGFINVGLDRDGILRRAPLLIALEGKLYPSLAFATYLQLRGLQQLVVSLSPAGVDLIKTRDLAIPVGPQSNLLINYRSREHNFERISAAEVMGDQVSHRRLEGRAVFVGVTASGLKDIRATPLEAAFPGVEVHATILDNLLRADFLTAPAWVPSVEVGLVLALGLASSAMLAWLNALWGAVMLLGGTATLWAASNYLMHSLGLFISPLWPVLVLTANFSLLTLVRFRQEEIRVRRAYQKLARTQHAAIISLAALAETRDNDTGAHIKRTQRYVEALAQRLSRHPAYRSVLDESYIELLAQSAPLHDVGKVGVRDAVLLKPGPLTPEEFEEIKQHTTYGMEAIRSAEKELGESSFLSLAREIAYCHHEKWDGTGYPRGLKGEEIPLAARFMALADVYDAIISRRVYKPPMPHSEAVSFIQDGRGVFFDPLLTDTFMEIEEEIRGIAQALADPSPQPDPNMGRKTAGQAL